MARAAKAATTKVRIAPHRSVVIDGRPVGAGEVVEVTQQDADTLLAEGYAVSADAPEADPAEESRRVFDENGAEVEHTKRGRRALTPKVIDDGTEERGQ